MNMNPLLNKIIKNPIPPITNEAKETNREAGLKAVYFRSITRELFREAKFFNKQTQLLRGNQTEAEKFNRVTYRLSVILDAFEELPPQVTQYLEEIRQDGDETDNKILNQIYDHLKKSDTIKQGQPLN